MERAWELLTTVLERYGLAFAVLVAVLGAFGLAIKMLWDSKEALSKQLITAGTTKASEIAELHAEYAKREETLEATFRQERAELRSQLDRVIKELSDVQERRITEMTKMARESTETIVSTGASVEKLSALLQGIMHGHGSGKGKL